MGAYHRPYNSMAAKKKAYKAAPAPKKKPAAKKGA